MSNIFLPIVEIMRFGWYFRRRKNYKHDKYDRDREYFYGTPIALGYNIDLTPNCEIFWYVKMKNWYLGKKQKIKNRNGHAICNGAINSE